MKSLLKFLLLTVILTSSLTCYCQSGSSDTTGFAVRHAGLIYLMKLLLGNDSIVLSTSSFAGAGTLASPLTVIGGSSGSGVADSLRVVDSAHRVKNFYYDSNRHEIAVVNPSGTKILYFKPVDSVTLGGSGGGGGGTTSATGATALTINSVANGTLTQSPTGTYTASANNTQCDFTKTLHASTAGWVEMSMNQNSYVNQTVLSLSTTPGPQAYTSMTYGVFIFNNSGTWTYQEVTSGSPISLGIAAQNTDIVRVNRSSGGTVTLDVYRSGAWTNLYTYGGTSTGILYPNVAVLNVGELLMNPSGSGLQ